MSGLPLDHKIDQKGPRAHHFVVIISVLVGLSFVVESRSVMLTEAFRILLIGQKTWGWLFLTSGLLVSFSPSPLFRAFSLSLSTTLWALFAGITAWGTWFGPQASLTTSFVAILSFALVLVCVLACSNLRRDYLPLPDRRFLRWLTKRKSTC